MSDSATSPRSSTDLDEKIEPQEKPVNPLRQANERFRAEVRSLLARLQTIDFGSHLSPLRPGHTYSLEIRSRLRDVQHGGVNVHLPLIWDDGVKWLVRIKLHCVMAYGRVPSEVRKMALESERETMICLRSKGLPVPEVYGPMVVTDGIEFIVVECLDGTPCSRPIMKNLTEVNLDQVIRQLARFQVDVSAFTFNSIGSLYQATPPPSPSSSSSKANDPILSTAGPDGVEQPPPRIGPSISLRFYNTSSPHFLGPFTTSGERYIANIDHMLAQIDKSVTSLGHPAVVYLVHLWIRDVVVSTPSLWEQEDIMLRHADDQGDHIFLDKDGKLLAVIDWEWAVTASKSEAFAAPMGLVETQPFDHGSNELSPSEIKLATAFDDLDRPDLADCVRSGKLHQRLRAMIGGKPSIGMIRGLADAVGKDVEAMGLPEFCGIEWRRYQSDAVLSRLVQEDGLSWEERCEAQVHFDWL